MSKKCGNPECPKGGDDAKAMRNEINFCFHCGHETVIIHEQIRSKMYLNTDRDSMYEMAREIGLEAESEAEHEFSGTAYELECTITTDSGSGKSKMIGIKDCKTGLLVEFTAPVNI